MSTVGVWCNINSIALLLAFRPLYNFIALLQVVSRIKQRNVLLICLYFQGLYAMSMNCMEAAEAQFKTALKVINYYYIY